MESYLFSFYMIYMNQSLMTGFVLHGHILLS